MAFSFRGIEISVIASGLFLLIPLGSFGQQFQPQPNRVPAPNYNQQQPRQTQPQQYQQQPRQYQQGQNQQGQYQPGQANPNQYRPPVSNNQQHPHRATTGQPRQPAQPGQRTAATPNVPIPNPMPFQLTPQQKEERDAILKAWEERRSQITRLSCTFNSWERETVFNKSVIERQGKLIYEAPEKGAYWVQWERVLENNNQNGSAEAKWEKKLDLPHWTCNGSSVFEVKHAEKKVIEHQLPEDMKGNAIGNGPLPFLFVAGGDHLKKRYFIRAVTTPQDKAKGQIWLEIYPRFQQDAASFRRAELILNEKDFLPIGMKLFLNNEKTEVTHVFKDYGLNAGNSLWGKLQSVWGGNPFEPKPLGYKLVQGETAPTAATASKPEPVNSKSRFWNFFQRKDTTTK